MKIHDLDRWQKQKIGKFLHKKTEQHTDPVAYRRSLLEGTDFTNFRSINQGTWTDAGQFAIVAGRLGYDVSDDAEVTRLLMNAGVLGNNATSVKSNAKNAGMPKAAQSTSTSLLELPVREQNMIRKLIKQKVSTNPSLEKFISGIANVSAVPVERVQDVLQEERTWLAQDLPILENMCTFLNLPNHAEGLLKTYQREKGIVAVRQSQQGMVYAGKEVTDEIQQRLAEPPKKVPRHTGWGRQL